MGEYWRLRGTHYSSSFAFSKFAHDFHMCHTHSRQKMLYQSLNLTGSLEIPSSCLPRLSLFVCFPATDTH